MLRIVGCTIAGEVVNVAPLPGDDAIPYCSSSAMVIEVESDLYPQPAVGDTLALSACDTRDASCRLRGVGVVVWVGEPQPGPAERNALPAYRFAVEAIRGAVTLTVDGLGSSAGYWLASQTSE